MLQCYIASIRCYSHYSHAILLLVHLNHFGPKIELSQWAVNPGAMASASRQVGRVVCGVLLLCLMIDMLTVFSMFLWPLAVVGCRGGSTGPALAAAQKAENQVYKYQNLP